MFYETHVWISFKEKYLYKKWKYAYMRKKNTYKIETLEEQKIVKLDKFSIQI